MNNTYTRDPVTIGVATLDAIDEDNCGHLREELGDLLLQIVLHSQIATENRKFSLLQVVNDIHKKIVNFGRYPKKTT